MSARTIILLAALTGALGGCGGTETGNPNGASVAFGVRASDPASVGVEADGGTGHRVEALLLSVAEAALIGCGDSVPEASIYTGPVVIDVVAGARGDRPIGAGEYCGIRMTLAPDRLPAAGDAPAVANATVAVHGVRADGVPFTVESRKPLVIAASGEPFAVRDGEELLVAFDVSPWLGNGLLEAAPIVGDRATIDGTGEPAAQFEGQLTVGVHRDVDHDGTVDAGETRPLVAEGPSQ